MSTKRKTAIGVKTETVEGTTLKTHRMPIKHPMQGGE
jgi:hypothetical protein